MFLIADVSGKGVPAALFMMTAKTLINYIAQSHLPPEEMAKEINRKICSNNKHGFFVTMLAGIIDLTNGKLSLINCGHNPPIIKKKNQKYNYLKLASNIVLGAFDETNFKVEEMTLDAGDTLILYTDGITEAENNLQEMYGENKLLDILNNSDDSNLQQLHKNIREDVKAFTNGFPQNDDMTLLSFRFNGKSNRVYKGIASKTNFKYFTEWLEKSTESYNLKQNLTYRMQLVSEEIYTNVFSYSYPENEGEIEVRCVKDENYITLSYIYGGIEYNPTQVPPPDITLPPEKRPKGGLGIFIVKQLTEKTEYKYENGKNIVTAVFALK